jgi:putative transposase
MARRLRIQFGGALYHIINRGNYRRPVFGTVGAARAFEFSLSEVCGRFAWRLHAYVILPNHFHLALETPQPNLVEGMHWLQSTFATRFNRLRSERGHLFQGRYQALLIEDVAALVRVVNYIHLNPVRAKLVPLLHCGSFRWSSLGRFVRRERMSCLYADSLLAQLGFEDSVAGWARYLGYLRDWATRPEEEHDQREFCSGWAIGTAGWKRAVARDYSHLATVPDLDATELRDIRERRWQELLEGQLRATGRNEPEISRGPRDAPWKIEIAARLRKHGVPYRWISDTLCMGAPHVIRAHVFRRAEHRSA